MLSLFLCLFSPLALVAQERAVVKGIEIVGNEHIAESEILKAIGFGVGDEISADDVAEAREAIEGMGYFAEVKSELEFPEGGGVVVRFLLVEYPVIRRIEIVGLPEAKGFGRGLIPYFIEWLRMGRRVSRQKVLSILEDHGIKPGEVLNAVELRKALEEVLEEFRRNDIATAQVTRVVPGEELVIEIRELPVVGNQFVGLSTVPEDVARALVGVEVGKVGKLSQIRDSYLRLSRSVYFRDVNVVPVVTEGGVVLRWELKERVLLPSPTELSGIRLIGVEAFPEDLIEAKLGPLPEGKADNYDVLRALEGVFFYYVREGYFMVDLRSEGMEEGVLKVRVLEGRISRIEISGNRRTKEIVIRRALGLGEGDYLTESSLFAAQQSLRGLGYFSEVDLEPVRKDGELVLRVSLRELDKLGRIGGSMSLSQGELVGNLQYAQRNILGTAQDLSLTLSRGITGSPSTSWTLEWTAHALPVFDLASAKFYRTTEGEKRTLGGSLDFAYPLRELWDLELGFTSELRWEGEEALPPRNVLELGLSFDDRDDPFFFPRRGGYWRLSVEKAGTFAPGVEYLSLKGEIAGYRPLDLPFGEGLRGALAQRALLAWGFGLPEEYRFELGGPNSVRGAASPSKVDRLALLNIEFRLELAQGAHVALFWDLGVPLEGSGTAKSSFGIELAVRLMGTFVRLDLAWPNDRGWTWVPQFEFAWSPLF